MEYIINREAVHTAMKQHGIATQAELAERLGITKNQMSVLLSDRQCPIKNSYQQLFHLLELNPMDAIIQKGNASVKKAKRIRPVNCTEDDLNAEYVDTSTVNPRRRYTSVELFAGAGGLALGLEQAGFDVQCLVEFEKYACETLRLNRPEWNLIEADIIDIAENGIWNYIPSDCKEIDFVSGGYPCQAFSYAGKKLGLEDVRGTMFFYFAQIVDQLHPKIFLAENVRGLLTHDNGRTLQTMLDIYRNMGYRVETHLMHAVDYGVAQKRERLIIVGIRSEFPVQYRMPKIYDKKLVLRDVLKDVPHSDGEKYPPKKEKVLRLVPPGGYWRDLPENIAREYMGKSYFSGGGRTGMARRISWVTKLLH